MSASWRPQKVASVTQGRNKKKRSGGGDEAAEGMDEEAPKDPSAGSSEQSKSGGGAKTRRGRRSRAKAEPKPVARDKGLKLMIACLAKVSLQSAQNARAALGCLVDSILMPSDCDAAKAVAAEGDAYAERAGAIHEALGKEKKGTTKHGEVLRKLKSVPAPSRGNFIAFLEAIAANSDGGKSNAEKIKAWATELGETLPDVSVCKLKSIKDPDKSMVLIAMRWIPVRPQILDCCLQLGYEVKCDTPPTTAAEDELSAWLEALG